jgi:nucleoside-diphosphate-sugar epimerase
MAKVLVTGASGFLGQHVVRAFLQRGVAVRAMVRPASKIEHLDWAGDVEVVRADLRVADDLDRALAGVDTVVHLAACVAGDDDLRFASTVVGTERLLDAMGRSKVRRFVLASSFSVYEFGQIRGTLNEDSPLESNLYERDGYDIAKSWQERITRRMSEAHDWDLRVLRPGFIWGPDNAPLAGIGQDLGRLHLVFGFPGRRIPLTHVENCADCFVAVTLDARAAGRTFNVVDDEGVSAWGFMGEYLRGMGNGGVRVVVPYWLGYGLTRVARAVSQFMFRGDGKLPSILVPCQFEARFKPLRFTNRRLREVLDWTPPISYRECLSRTFPSKRSSQSTQAPGPGSVVDA